MTWNSDLFRDHIENRDATTKGDRAQFLYRTFDWDTALPVPWVRHILANLPPLTHEEVTANFVWLYKPGDCFSGFPAPLTIIGCDILERLELVLESGN